MARRLLLALLPALLLASCAGLYSGPQIPGRRGIMFAMEELETAASWHNWPAIIEAFYLPEHAEEVKDPYGGDIGRWFRASKEVGVLAGGEFGRPRRICPLAFREKHISDRFDPHYVVYYRIQEAPCEELLAGQSPPALAEGRMEWGFEVKGRRWVHLRPLDKAAAQAKPIPN